jgi:hypothetical protein
MLGIQEAIRPAKEAEGCAYAFRTPVQTTGVWHSQKCQFNLHGVFPTLEDRTGLYVWQFAFTQKRLNYATGAIQSNSSVPSVPSRTIAVLFSRIRREALGAIERALKSNVFLADRDVTQIQIE